MFSHVDCVPSCSYMASTKSRLNTATTLYESVPEVSMFSGRGRENK
jgi:hypothetical protein